MLVVKLRWEQECASIRQFSDMVKLGAAAYATAVKRACATQQRACCLFYELTMSETIQCLTVSAAVVYMTTHSNTAVTVCRIPNVLHNI